MDFFIDQHKTNLVRKRHLFVCLCVCFVVISFEVCTKQKDVFVINTFCENKYCQMIPYHKKIFYFPHLLSSKVPCQMGVMQLKSVPGSGADDGESYGSQSYK